MRSPAGMIATMALLTASCGGAADQPPTFAEWCASVPAADCAQMATEVAAGYIDPACVIRAVDADEASRCFGQAVPATTIPPDFESASPPGDREFIERAVEETLLEAHPNSTVTFGVILRAPMSLEAADSLASELGGAMTAVWRVDQVCVPAAGGFPGQEPARFAFVDGEERAAEERRAADEGRTVVTGRHIVESVWARWEEAAAALQPHTEVVAIAIDATVSSLPSIRATPDVGLVRLAGPGVEYAFTDDELAPPVPLSCED